MKSNIQIASPGLTKVDSECQDSKVRPNPTNPLAKHPYGGVSLGIKRLLAVGALVLSLNVLADNAAAFDRGTHIKIVRQQMDSMEMQKADSVLVNKQSIIYIEIKYSHVKIQLTTGALEYAFESTERAEAFAAHVSEFIFASNIPQSERAP